MYSDVSVPSNILQSYFDAFKTVQNAPRTVFLRHGLGLVGPNDEFELAATAPLPKLIQATNELVTLVGPQKAYEIGLGVVENATKPEGATDIISAMQILDVGYHLNHLKDGLPMFDVATGTMIEGIGHYKFVSASKHRVVMDIDAPYHCDLDRGIIQGWAKKFKRTALVTHIEPQVCRKNRATHCRYEVSWK